MESSSETKVIIDINQHQNTGKRTVNKSNCKIISVLVIHSPHPLCWLHSAGQMTQDFPRSAFISYKEGMLLVIISF